MIVREYIKKKIPETSIKEVIEGLEGLIEYSEMILNDRLINADPENKLDKEYDGSFENIEDDPWISDIIICEKAIELIKNAQ